MKILFFTSSQTDYLQQQLLIGLRGMFGSDIVDYPKREEVYETCTIPRTEMWGLGFTTHLIIPDIPVDRENVFQRMRDGEFDYIIIGAIFRSSDVFWKLWNEIHFQSAKYKFVFLDGEDWARPYYPALPAALYAAPYFKREQKQFKRIPWVHRIGFSIPDCKLRGVPLEKDRLFPSHVQCEEAYKIPYIQENCQKSYAFSQEADYYNDLARSRYGITMKKGGWDCMRHYEIAANHTVQCFYRLKHKSEFCAPHGLVDMENVIAFDTAEELQAKLDEVERRDLYPKLQAESFRWAQENSCSRAAANFLSRLDSIYAE